MKKILTIDQVRQADAYTIENEPVASIQLMERAASACALWITENLPHYQEVKIFCGMGNNGGDGLVIARKLAEEGKKVEVFTVMHTDTPSPDYTTMLERITTMLKHGVLRKLKDEGQLTVTMLQHGGMPLVEDHVLLVDALLGSGLTRPVTGLLAEVIENINKTACFKLAIDVPSGLFCDEPSDPSKGTIIRANHTLTFEVPKLAFFFPENEEFIGDWSLISIGLHPSFLEEVATRNYLLEEEDIALNIRKRSRFSHKGNYGHGLLVAGSYGKMGAAILAARAALRTGAGLITSHIPKKGYPVIQAVVPEGMYSIDNADDFFSAVPDLIPYNAIAIGPGIGTSAQTANALKLLIQNSQLPLILDADALNILAENKTWLSFLPRLSILTPHLKEFERLTAKAANSFERNRMQVEFSRKYGVYIVLKGAFTSISFPDGKCFFNPTGNPGMATGGSGDVLTGIILGFLSQRYTPGEAAVLGTYIHGLAGDLAAAAMSKEAMIAGDIVDFLPQVYPLLNKRK